MIINKITNGYVIQSFDTETNKFISQGFIAEDSEYETEDGVSIDPADCMPKPKPYLPFDMKQPDEFQGPQAQPCRFTSIPKAR